MRCALDESLCHRCAALCCRYIALPIKDPVDRQSCDEARWFLLHEGTIVFRAAGAWYVCVTAHCRHVTPDQRCGIYETRPDVCREYGGDACDFVGGEYEYDLLFAHPAQMEAYAEELLGEPLVRPADAPAGPPQRRATGTRRAAGNGKRSKTSSP